MNPSIESFQQFYPIYLSAHQNVNCRRMHLLGNVFAAAAIASFVRTGRWRCLAAAPLLGYGMSWMGHFVFEKNLPRVFKHPLYSFLGDLRMAADTVRGRLEA